MPWPVSWLTGMTSSGLPSQAARLPSGYPVRGTAGDFPITVARAAPVLHRIPVHHGMATLTDERVGLTPSRP